MILSPGPSSLPPDMWQTVGEASDFHGLFTRPLCYSPRSPTLSPRAESTQETPRQQLRADYKAEEEDEEGTMEMRATFKQEDEELDNGKKGIILLN